MRKLRAPPGGGEKLGVLAFEAAALMSRAAGLWRALGDAPLARLRGEAVRLEGARRLVADDDAALLALALAEMAAACAGLSRAVARLAARCRDPLLRRFGALYAALVAGGGAADPHGVRYAAARKMDRKAREMQRLVALTAHLAHELDVLAELEQALPRRAPGPGGGECARRVARQRREVERLRAASLWGRTFDHAVRLLARSLFTVVARIVDVFGLEPPSSAAGGDDDDDGERSSSSPKLSRLSWSGSFAGGGGMHTHSMVYPSDAVGTPRRTRSSGPSGKKIAAGADDARRFLMARSRSLRQLRWPAAAGRHLVGCVVAGGRSSPGRDGWAHVSGDADLPLSFSYVSDEFGTTTSNNNSFQFQAVHHARTRATARPSTSVFEPSRHDVLASAPGTTLGGAGLALHYANLIMLIERLAASPHEICADERDALYGMLTASVRAALGARLRPLAKGRFRCDPVLGAEWGDTVRRILAWLAPLAHNMVRWHAERSFEQRSVASSAGAGAVLLLQTLHFADRRKTEAALTELLVGLDYMWRHAMELEAKAVAVKCHQLVD
ncbi:hypothetical protein BS78_08G022500 [Paspalum vaginatum]|nr:hypothetical protein BS78_08G022500 [Paspalum vaginatum]